ncbi:MAG: fructose-6-phosphate aldolase [Deltaproteobacteria bacterium]|nr:fructose-6-phosphate aldolase [Deltaproteobacteria bacterium]
MKFFIDSANIDDIRTAVSWGVLDGVTTNPSLVAKEGKKIDDVYPVICDLVQGPVSLEAVSMTAPEMVAEGKELCKYGDNVVVKLPMTTDGLAATKELAKDGIPVNMTLCFSPLQALLAAKAGAAYISPFVGRLDDISAVGMELISQIIQIYDNYDFATEVLVASIRNPIHALEAAMMGADVATIPFSVMQQFAKHPLTDRGIEQFLEDWKKVPHA